MSGCRTRSWWPSWVVAVVLVTVMSPASWAQEPQTQLSPDLDAWLEEHGPVRVAVIEDAAPSHVISPEGEIRGWSIELIRLGALKTGVNLDLTEPMPLSKAVAALREGRLDVVMGVAGRPELASFAERVTFIEAPLTFVTTARHDEFRSVEDLRGTTSTITGSPMVGLLEERFPHLTYVETGFIADGVDALLDGEIDSYLGPLPGIGYQLTQRQGTDVRPVGDPLSLLLAGAWTHRQTPELHAIAQSMREAITDGEISAIMVKWTGFDLGPASPGGVPAWLWWALAATLLLALAAVGLVLLLRRRVAAATAELRAVNLELEERVAQRTAELEQRSRELERSNDELDRFASVASHDLQEPLRMVSSYAQLLERSYGDDLDDEGQELLDYLTDGARRMRQLIADLLTLSRISTTSKQHVPVDLGQVVDEVRRDLSMAIEEADAAVEANNLPVIDGEPTHLRLLFQNLIGNALKYRRPDPPRVDVEAEEVADDTWEITVADNGIGVPEDRREDIFEPFVRLHGRSEYPGTGIGLAICRRVVERHGGHITVEDREPRGSRFRFTLRGARPNEGE